MERAKANERIVLSRYTFTRFQRMMGAGDRPLGAEALIREELRILDELAATFPDMEDKLVLLVQGRSGLLSRLEIQLN
jgi:hypothetical protein